MTPKRSVRCNPCGSGRGPVARALRMRGRWRTGESALGGTHCVQGRRGNGERVPHPGSASTAGSDGSRAFPPHGLGTVLVEKLRPAPRGGERSGLLSFDRRGRRVSPGGPRANTVCVCPERRSRLCSHRQWGVRVGAGGGGAGEGIPGRGAKRARPPAQCRAGVLASLTTLSPPFSTLPSFRTDPSPTHIPTGALALHGSGETTLGLPRLTSGRIFARDRATANAPAGRGGTGAKGTRGRATVSWPPTPTPAATRSREGWKVDERLRCRPGVFGVRMPRRAPSRQNRPPIPLSRHHAVWVSGQGRRRWAPVGPGRLPKG